MGSLASHNYGHIYLQKAIEACSKYAYSVLISSKSVEAAASAFRSIMTRNSAREPPAIPKNKGKMFLNGKISMLLDSEDKELPVYRIRGTL